MARSWLCPALLAMCATALSTTRSMADIVISLGSMGATNVNLGPAGSGKSIDFYIGQSPAANDQLIAIVARYSLQAGVVGTPAGIISSSDGTGDSNYFGFNQLSFSELTLDSGGPNTFLVNQEFRNNQPIPVRPSQSRWFTLNLDTSGLAEGIYSISLASPNESFQTPPGALIAANNNLTFTVSAVPEPSTMMGLALTSLSVMGYRRLRRVRSR